MEIEKLEAEKDALHEQLRELCLQRSEQTRLWQEQEIATPAAERSRLNYDIDSTKLQLTRAENELRRAKRQGRMDLYDALCFVCTENGHESYILEAEAIAAK